MLKWNVSKLNVSRKWYNAKVAKVRYSAIVLDDKSHSKLVEVFSPTWTDDYEVIAHHMTIKVGELPIGMLDLVNKTFTMKVVAFAGDDKVKAVEVESPVSTINKIPHITLAVNRKNGGKPMMSNYLDNWVPVKQPIYLTGTVQEIS